MSIEKIIGIILIFYGIYIVYDTYKHPDPFNKETWFVYQFKDYASAFFAFIIGLVLIFSKLSFNDIFN